MLQFRNIARRINIMRKAAGRGRGVEVCANVSSGGSDVDTGFDSGRYNRFDKRRRQNRLGQSLWDSETGRRTAYGERVLKKKNKGFDKKSDRHQQGKHAHTRTQAKRDTQKQQQQGDGKSFLRQHIRKPRSEHLTGREHIAADTRQLYDLQHKHTKPILNGLDENAPNPTRIQRFANELWPGLRQAKRERNIREAGYKRVSLIRKGVTNKKRRYRQANKKR